MAQVRRQIIAGNWKMNCSRQGAIDLTQSIIDDSTAQANVELLVCVPAIHLAEVSRLAGDAHLSVGAQDAHWEESGAYTGEISASMLSDYGVNYLLVGHSERRDMFGDSDERVAKKFVAALKYGIKPILCIGESLDEREQGVTMQVLQRQLKAVIDTAGIESFKNACVAYEPIWAIGTGRTASPEQAQEVHYGLRSWLGEFDQAIAEMLPILYGGSMNAVNANDLLQQPDIDGGLIGGASLKAKDFLQIYSAAG